MESLQQQQHQDPQHHHDPHHDQELANLVDFILENDVKKKQAVTRAARKYDIAKGKRVWKFIQDRVNDTASPYDIGMQIVEGLKRKGKKARFRDEITPAMTVAVHTLCGHDDNVPSDKTKLTRGICSKLGQFSGTIHSREELNDFIIAHVRDFCLGVTDNDDNKKKGMEQHETESVASVQNSNNDDDDGDAPPFKANKAKDTTLKRAVKTTRSGQRKKHHHSSSDTFSLPSNSTGNDDDDEEHGANHSNHEDKDEANHEDKDEANHFNHSNHEDNEDKDETNHSNHEDKGGTNHSNHEDKDKDGTNMTEDDKDAIQHNEDKTFSTKSHQWHPQSSSSSSSNSSSSSMVKRLKLLDNDATTTTTHHHDHAHELVRNLKIAIHDILNSNIMASALENEAKTHQHSCPMLVNVLDLIVQGKPAMTKNGN
jgi:hypothetical protein